MTPDRAADDAAAGSSEFRRGAAVLALANGLLYLAYVVLSFGMVVHAPFGEAQPREATAYGRLADALAPLGGGVQAFMRGESFLSDRAAFNATYAIVLVALSISFLLLLRLIARHRAVLDDRAATALMRWAALFALLLCFAAPVLVQDFWLSPAWGREIVHGANPYVTPTDAAAAGALPLDDLGMRMTYGPMWALVSGAIMFVARDDVLLAAVLFKLLLAAAWIGCVYLVGRILHEGPADQRCLGIAIVGWVPLGVLQSVGDGHNGIVMAALTLLWLYALERRQPRRASIALAASVLVKYMTAPLFLLDLLHVRLSRGARLRTYLPQAVMAAALAGACFAIFWSPEFFTATASMTGWHFYTPRDAVVEAGRLVGLEPGLHTLSGVLVIGFALAAQGAFLLVGLIALIRYWRAPAVDTFRGATAGLVVALLFGVIGHLWPWFMMLGLATAAIDPSAARVRWVVGYSLFATFPLLFWVADGGESHLTLTTPLLYAASVLFFLVAPRDWFGAGKGTGAGRASPAV
ncbi:MAG TPA: glycosyltransferase 87 family protein [Gemmatimonadaceae bacterium]|nr:glycosyltransferase 87 family protein [Gemmatimonadaceae bacterium]